ncbi:MAG: hypothetical protein R2880_14600 [Deinococcales bacterium]
MATISGIFLLAALLFAGPLMIFGSLILPLTPFILVFFVLLMFLFVGAGFSFYRMMPMLHWLGDLLNDWQLFDLVASILNGLKQWL